MSSTSSVLRYSTAGTTSRGHYQRKKSPTDKNYTTIDNRAASKLTFEELPIDESGLSTFRKHTDISQSVSFLDGVSPNRLQTREVSPNVRKKLFASPLTFREQRNRTPKPERKSKMFENIDPRVMDHLARSRDVSPSEKASVLKSLLSPNNKSCLSQLS